MHGKKVQDWLHVSFIDIASIAISDLSIEQHQKHQRCNNYKRQSTFHRIDHCEKEVTGEKNEKRYHGHDAHSAPVFGENVLDNILELL